MKYGHEKGRRRKTSKFRCINCKQIVSVAARGTRHRNHCPHCLWSKHLDRRPGDRQAVCGGAMEPIGLAFKSEGGKKQGELMVVHKCQICGVIRKNRIAGDDQEAVILEVFQHSRQQRTATGTQSSLVEADIRLLDSDDEREVLTQLFGKPNVPSKG